MVVLLDTGFILAARNQDDVNHLVAVQLMRECLAGKYGQILVNNLVFNEIATLTLVRTHDIRLIKDIGRFILGSPRIKMVHMSEPDFLVAWELFLKYFEHNLSFVDCSLLALTRLFEPEAYIATFDSQFKGLVALLPAQK
jgi:predicted nucleic acid-binding protein